MSIFTNPTLTQAVSNMNVENTHTLYYDISGYQPTEQGIHAFWFTLENDSSHSVIIGPNGGINDESKYIYNNNGSQNNATINGNIISISFFLPSDECGDTESKSYNPLGPSSVLSVKAINIYTDLDGITHYDVSTIYTQAVTIQAAPQLTPLYLGNAKINSTGDVEFQNSILTTLRYPDGQHELVPRAYVDKYIQNVVSFYNGILDISGNGVNLGLIERITNLEDQLERVYQAWWQKPRDEPTIVIGNGTGSPIVLAFEPAVDTNIGDESGLLQSNGVIHVPVAPANASSIGF
jgi:hypothetical protein